ncbi:MAG: GPW/gp25 family protein [Limnohabitans sp.]|nr:GPW/gp25 family protein [Limnohabitans sp.]
MSYSYYKIPFSFKKLTSGGEAEKITIDESIAQFISVIMTTVFGEYKYDEEFGTIIWDTDFNFLANVNLLKEQIKDSIFEKINQYEKRIGITNVQLVVVEDTLSSDVKIRVKKRLDVLIHGIVRQTNQPYYFRSSYYMAPFSYK